MKTKKKKKNLKNQWIVVEAAERLKKEEAYHQFVSELSEDDYRLIRNKNLLGTPGEKTMEELQLLLDQAKENSAAQSNVGDLGAEAESGCPEAPEEHLSEESILQWINTFCHTGIAILSRQNQNQVWRALSQRSSDTGEFQFRLKINTSNEFQNSGIPWEGYTNIPDLDINGCQLQQINQSPPPNSPQVRQNRTEPSSVNAAMLRVMRGSRRQYTREGPSSRTMGSLRSGAQEFRERFTDGHSHSRPIQFSRHVNAIILREAHERSDSPRFQRHRERNSSPMSHLREKIETLKLRSTGNSNSHSSLQRPADIISRRKQIIDKLKRYHHHHIVQNEQEQEGSPQFSQSSALLTLPTTATSHTTLRLNLRVKVLPEEEIAQETISSRTRSRFQRSREANRSNRGVFQLVVSRSEDTRPQSCFRTSWLPLHGIAEPEFRQPRVLQVLLQQILAGLSTLSFSNETRAYLEKQKYNQYLWDINSELFNFNRIRVQRELNGTPVCSTSEGYARQNNDVSHLIENIIVPTLRLAHMFLLSDDSWYCSGGLTNEEIDKLATKNYESSINGEINKVCTICVNTYTPGNKLRQLPCTHEFHIHCIDRWLAENNTCPICRQAVLNSDTV